MPDVSYFARDGRIRTSRGSHTLALALTVDSLDNIPESVRSFYEPDGDRFRLAVDGLEDPVGLKTALQKEREAARNFEKETKAWKQLGKTPEEIQTLIAAANKAEEDRLKRNGEWSQLKAQMNEQTAREKAELQEKLSAKDKAIEKYLIDAQATAAISELKGSARILLPHVKASVKVVEENGSFLTRVVDDSGNPRVNAKGKYLTIKDLVSEMRQSEDFGRAFDATGTTGGGATGSQRTGSPQKGKIDGTPEERIAYLKSKYPELG